MGACKQFRTGHPEAVPRWGINVETISTDFLHLGKVCHRADFSLSFLSLDHVKIRQGTPRCRKIVILPEQLIANVSLLPHGSFQYQASPPWRKLHFHSRNKKKVFPNDIRTSTFQLLKTSDWLGNLKESQQCNSHKKYDFRGWTFRREQGKLKRGGEMNKKQDRQESHIWKSHCNWQSYNKTRL